MFIDICVLSFLMVGGEKIVMWFLDEDVLWFMFEMFGLWNDSFCLFFDKINNFYGLIFVGGLIGVGKMMIFYFCLMVVDCENCYVVIIEDLVEYCL